MMQQKDQESAVTPKKHWKKALDVNPTENKSPSVAARSAIFQSNKVHSKDTQSFVQGRLQQFSFFQNWLLQIVFTQLHCSFIYYFMLTLYEPD